MTTTLFDRSLLLASSLAVTTAASPAVASPSAVAPSPPDPAAPAEKLQAPGPAPSSSHWFELTIGVNASSVDVSHAEMPGTNRGFGKGFVLDAAFYPVAQVALVAEVWWLSTSFELCVADASCFNYLAEDQTRFTAGLRLPVLPFFYLQGSAGVVGSATRYDDLLWSSVLVGLLAFRLPAGSVELGLDARASTMSESGASITTVGVSATVSKRW